MFDIYQKCSNSIHYICANTQPKTMVLTIRFVLKQHHLHHLGTDDLGDPAEVSHPIETLMVSKNVAVIWWKSVETTGKPLEKWWFNGDLMGFDGLYPLVILISYHAFIL